jgi:hypothetical protein
MIHKGRLFALLATSSAATIAVLLGTMQAAGAAVGGRVYSPEQAGYSLTGVHVKYLQDTVALPNSSSITQVGGLGVSLQFWNASEVFVFGLSNSTGTSSNYTPAVAVYDVATHNLVCSTAAATPCPGTPASWTSGAANFFAQGDNVTTSISYSSSGGSLTFRADDLTNGLGTKYIYKATTGLKFNQVRVGAEFGCSPWDTTLCGGTYTSSDTVPLTTFSGVTVTTSSGVHSSLSGVGTAHKIIMTSNGTSSGTVEVAPTALSNKGHNFSVDFK